MMEREREIMTSHITCHVNGSNLHGFHHGDIKTKRGDYIGK
jgi:hypothetical protein